MNPSSQPGGPGAPGVAGHGPAGPQQQLRRRPAGAGQPPGRNGSGPRGGIRHEEDGLVVPVLHTKDGAQLPTPRNYWMIAITLENFRLSKARGFTVQGLGRAQQRKAERVEVGDRLLYYVHTIHKFPATAVVLSKMTEDRTPIWVPDRPDEDFRYRFDIQPVEVLEEEDFIDALQVAPRLEYVKKWIPEHWPRAFIGELHLIPKKDFLMIEEEMRKITTRKARV